MFSLLPMRLRGVPQCAFLSVRQDEHVQRFKTMGVDSDRHVPSTWHMFERAPTASARLGAQTSGWYLRGKIARVRAQKAVARRRPCIAKL